MTHYPAWIALVVFSAAFAAVNLVGVENWEVFVWEHGWPQTWGTRDLAFARAGSIESQLSSSFWRHLEFPRVDQISFSLDLMVALAATAGAVYQVAKIKAKLSLQAVFAVTAIVGAGCLTLRYNSLGLFLLDARTAALFIIPVAIGLACLSVLNLVGWMYGKCKSR